MAPTIAIDKLTGKAKVAMYNKYAF
jgi:hypothetical protein